MDSNAFDNLTKSLAERRGRRGVLRAMAVAAGASLLGAVARNGGSAAATCRPGGSLCRKAGDCCSGACETPDATLRRYCACESGATPCGTNACCKRGEVCV